LFVAQHTRQDTEAGVADGARFAVVLIGALVSIGAAAAGRALIWRCAGGALSVDVVVWRQALLTHAEF
jgi:hypothetical protein